MKIYFVRHGQTNSNVEVRHQFPDTPLSEVGQQQAKAIGERFRHLPLDLIITSSYTRTKQTAEEIKKVTSAPLIESELFIERIQPSIVKGKLIHSPEIAQIHQAMKKHMDDKDWHHSDEENYFDLLARVNKAIHFIESQEVESVAVVTHGYILGLILCVILFGENFSPVLFRAFREHSDYLNTGLTMCEYHDGNWKLLTYNDYAHLGE